MSTLLGHEQEELVAVAHQARLRRRAGIPGVRARGLNLLQRHVGVPQLDHLHRRRRRAVARRRCVCTCARGEARLLPRRITDPRRDAPSGLAAATLDRPRDHHRRRAATGHSHGDSVAQPRLYGGPEHQAVQRWPVPLEAWP